MLKQRGKESNNKFTYSTTVAKVQGKGVQDHFHSNGGGKGRRQCLMIEGESNRRLLLTNVHLF